MVRRYLFWVLALAGAPIATRGAMAEARLAPQAKAGALSPNAVAAGVHAANVAPPLTIKPFGVVLPARPLGGPVHRVRFANAATRAVLRVYEDDNDDPAPVLALLGQIDQRHELASMRPQWAPILNDALRRAQTLSHLGAVIRGVRHAMAGAFLNDARHAYQEVDVAACDAAFAALAEADPAVTGAWRDFYVTIEPVGTLKLGDFYRLCEASRVSMLQQSRVPGTTARRNVVKMVRSFWPQANVNAKIARVNVIRPWWRDRTSGHATLEVAVGVRLPKKHGKQSCAIKALTFDVLGHHEQPVLAGVRDLGAILCASLSR